MRLLKPYTKIIYMEDGQTILSRLERIGRTCYKSETKITPETYLKFCQSLINRGHESVIEHATATVKFVVDRGISYELVRHRLASFSQESTRYVKYDGDMSFIIPCWLDIPEGDYSSIDMLLLFNRGQSTATWLIAMMDALCAYESLIEDKWSPQQARSVLPNSLKTEVIVTANMREWRHIFKLRTTKAAHPQMREVMIPLLKEFQNNIPVLFSDIKVGDK